jgi:hypothetical protein
MSHFKHSIAAAALGLALTCGTNLALADTSHFYGRWTVSDDKPAFSKKGMLYKTIDVSPCGNDFCGVSVSEDKTCGQTLFRFFTTHAKDEELSGHGVWGSIKKKLMMGYATPQDAKAYLYLGVGEDDMDFSEREGSVPTFQANYKLAGEVACTVK